MMLLVATEHFSLKTFLKSSFFLKRSIFGSTNYYLILTLLRPLALLDFNTFLPPGVAILALKPLTRCLFLLVPSSVLFIILTSLAYIIVFDYLYLTIYMYY